MRILFISNEGQHMVSMFNCLQMQATGFAFHANVCRISSSPRPSPFNSNLPDPIS
jgi:hypothetical protein